MGELIMSIALLCQISPAVALAGSGRSIEYSPEYVTEYQLGCQRYYVRCTKVGKVSVSDASKRLPDCILERGK